MNENARKAAMYAELYSPKTPVVHVDLFAEREKELAEARAEIERLALEIENKQYTITCASEENQQLKESLAEALAEIEKQDTLLEKCLSLLKQQKERGE